MAIIYNENITVQGIEYFISIDDEFLVSEEREYLPNFAWNSRYSWVNSVAGNVIQTGSFYSNTDIDEYTAICQRSDGLFLEHNGGSNNSVKFIVSSDNRSDETHYNNIMFPVTQGWAVNVGTQVVMVSISTNIPIFLYEDEQYYNIYKNTSRTLEERNEALKHAINYTSGETVKDTKEFYYYGYAHNYTVDEFGNYSENDEPVLYKGFRVKSTGRVSLYVVDGIDDGNLKLKINMSDVEIAYYSYDGVTWQNQQSSPTTLPFDFVWRKWNKEIGTFYCSGISGNLYETNCYIFGTKEESDDYNEYTDFTGQGALNYGDVNPDAPFNPTGLEDEETTFGEVYTRAFFSQQYICSATALQEISNALFDTTQGGITGIFEDIKKGLEMYGENVIDAVQGCMFYPFDLNQVFTNTQNQSYIYFGGYKFDLQNTSVNKIIYPNGYIDFGSVKIERTFNNYRDYAPYQRLYVYLPYIGWMELDINKYLDKTVNVKYFVDTRSGMALCVLSANGVFTDYASGQLGVSIPMTLTDYSRFASAQIQTLCSGGKSALSQGGVGGSLGQGVAQGLIESGAVNPALMAGGGFVLGTALQGTKTLYGLTQNNINNFNKTIGNGSTSMLNEYLPQEVCFMFEIQDADITPNELSLQGYPSNASGTVGSFTGYLEVDTVNLICADATANEKAEIVNMLHSGVYI